MHEVTFDVETTTRNKGNPFTASNKMVSSAVKLDDEETQDEYYTDVEYLSKLRHGIDNAKLIIGFNAKFDLHWAARYGIRPHPRARVWDCQIGEFILSGQRQKYPSLNGALERFGLGHKDEEVSEYWKAGVDTTDIPKDILLKYNKRDVDLTRELYKRQVEAMTPQQHRLCMLQGLDLLVLQEMEENGLKYNVEKSKELAGTTEAELGEVQAELLTYSPTPSLNLGSTQQLSFFLFGGNLTETVIDRTERRTYKSGQRKGEEYDKHFYKDVLSHFEPIFRPIKGSELALEYQGQTVYATGEPILKQLKANNKKQRRVIELLNRLAYLDKMLSGYYKALPELLEEMDWGDVLHPQYNQTVAATGRLSSSKP